MRSNSSGTHSRLFESLEQVGRSLVLFSLVLAGSLAQTDQACSQWYSQNAGTQSVLWSVDFINTDLGWIIYADTVLKTTDGGTTWMGQSVGIPSSLIGVAFVNETVGWAVGGHSGNSVIIKTTDGGDTWSDISPGVGAFMNGVFFIDDVHGWAFGQSGFPGNGKVVSTTDGGESWVDQPVGLVSYLEAGFFVDTLVGWAVGNNVLLKTTNGGAVWTEQDTAYTHGSMSVPLHSCFFVNADTGWVVGGIQWVSVIAKTTNGGEAWTHQIFQPPAPELDVGRLNSVHFANDSTGWIVGRVYPLVDELILKTTDGGSSFERQDNGTGSGQLQSVAFVDEQYGWAVGEAGTILATTNGGVSNVPVASMLPSSIKLYQNYPNPFNPETTFEFELPARGYVRLVIVDLLGKTVVTLINDVINPGSHRVRFSAEKLSSGTYFAFLWTESANGYMQHLTVKLLVIK